MQLAYSKCDLTKLLYNSRPTLKSISPYMHKISFCQSLLLGTSLGRRLKKIDCNKLKYTVGINGGKHSA